MILWYIKRFESIVSCYPLRDLAQPCSQVWRNSLARRCGRIHPSTGFTSRPENTVCPSLVGVELKECCVLLSNKGTI